MKCLGCPARKTAREAKVAPACWLRVRALQRGCSVQAHREKGPDTMAFWSRTVLQVSRTEEASGLRHSPGLFFRGFARLLGPGRGWVASGGCGPCFLPEVDAFFHLLWSCFTTSFSILDLTRDESVSCFHPPRVKERGKVGGKEEQKLCVWSTFSPFGVGFSQLRPLK